MGSSPTLSAGNMVAVAQLAEHQIVALGVASSTLVGHPIIHQGAVQDGLVLYHGGTVKWVT